MLKIGITGGIGSGKSTVARMFEVFGIPVYYADPAAKQLMNNDPHLRDAIIQQFGEASYHDGTLNRTYLADQVFRDPVKIEQMNALVHPVLLQDANRWMEQQVTPYAILEAALIFESGGQAQLDQVVGVTAPVALRIQRVMQRDGVTREEVISRMKNQVDDTIKMRLCDHVIHNDEQHLVIPQVTRLHEIFLQLAKS